MNVLIVKMSSMGDIIQTLPALTDAQQTFTDIKFDWVIEEAFSEIPAWHSSIGQIIPIAWRRWRKNLFTTSFYSEWQQFRQLLRMREYDYIIDAQGLLKSAFVTHMAKGVHCGYDRKSAREPLASLAYKKAFAVSKPQHAIARTRQLFAAVLHYTLAVEHVDYGIKPSLCVHLPVALAKKYCIFVVNTSKRHKRWPTANWRQLLANMQAAQQHVVIPCGYEHEELYAQSIAAGFSNVTLLSRTTLQQLREIIAQSQTVVSVDTGLAHLAAAIDRPTITLYGPTDVTRIGTVGKQQVHLLSKTRCLDIPAADVWKRMQSLLF